VGTESRHYHKFTEESFAPAVKQVPLADRGDIVYSALPSPWEESFAWQQTPGAVPYSYTVKFPSHLTPHVTTAYYKCRETLDNDLSELRHELEQHLSTSEDKLHLALHAANSITHYVAQDLEDPQKVAQQISDHLVSEAVGAAIGLSAASLGYCDAKHRPLLTNSPPPNLALTTNRCPSSCRSSRRSSQR
jgi:hypothetical protein